jgi:low temperature requirement protein LtrA
MRATFALTGRDPHEEHRVSTPLELFVDLCFVVAVAQAASQLHHALAEGHLTDALVGYPTVFFAIWWAWMNFTWFASAYDNDTVLYRLGVFVEVAGVLVLAAGVPRAFANEDFSVVIIGYVIMRLGLVTLWLLASRGDAEHRTTTRRYALGVSLVQLGWIALIWVPVTFRYPVYLVLVAIDLAVPVWAERTGGTPWHPHHIAERYGLFTIIVLGESILSITVSVQSALDADEAVGAIAPVALGALLTVCSMWWLYFSQPAEDVVDHAREAFEAGPSRYPFIWGYGHYVIFGAAAAVGAGYAVAVDAALHHAHLSGRGVSLAVAVPVALYVVSVWALHVRGWTDAGTKTAIALVLAAAVLAAGIAGAPVLVTGVLLAVGIVVFELSRRRPAR